MTEKSKKYLLDILNSIALVEEFVKECKSFDIYIQDSKTKSAVERQLGIIGEAVNLYQKSAPNYPLENSSKIITFRNWLIHAYDAVDNTTVWAVIQIHLPILKEEIRIRLREVNN